MSLTIDGNANSITSSTAGVNIPATVDTLSVGPSGSYMIANSSGVGIGTLTPQEKFHISNSASTNYIRLDNPSGRAYYGLNSSGDTEINAATNNNLIFKTFGTERARLDSSGNFGLGLTNPSSRLHVVASTGAAVIEQSGSTSWVMRHKTIQSYTNATAATLFTASPSSNCGLYVEVVVRGSNAVSNQAYKDTLYAFRYQIAGTYQNSNVTSASVTNIVGTHNAGTLAWVNVSSSTPSLTYTQANNGYILESLDVYVVARDSATITFNTSAVSYG